MPDFPGLSRSANHPEFNTGRNQRKDMVTFIQFILRSGLFAKIILLILLFLSIFSWGIIFNKFRRIINIKNEAKHFLRFFKMRVNWSDLFRQSQEFEFCPFARIFRENYTTLQQVLIPQQRAERQTPNPVRKSEISKSSLREKLELVISDEISSLEKRLNFLATTVSVSPFLGLLGTVWGIMTAFLSLGTGSADIGAVGPGIFEALITTVVGLGVAIPALVAYNYLVDRIQHLETDLSEFTTELLLILEQERIL
jgi:biopolymer transport protein TolQ